MKRLDLVQLTIVIVAIISGFFALQLVPMFLYYVFTWFSDGLSGGGFYVGYFITNILHLSAYLIITIYGIKQSKQLAVYICNKANIEGQINLSLNKFDLLYVLFIALGILGLTKELPVFLRDIVRYIQDANESVLSSTYGEPDAVKKIDLIEEVIAVGLFLVLLVYAKTFAEFLAARIKNTEPEDEINNDKQE